MKEIIAWNIAITCGQASSCKWQAEQLIRLMCLDTVLPLFFDSRTVLRAFQTH
jgi:hypothetical protein